MVSERSRFLDPGDTLVAPGVLGPVHPTTHHRLDLVHLGELTIGLCLDHDLINSCTFLA